MISSADRRRTWGESTAAIHASIVPVGRGAAAAAETQAGTPTGNRPSWGPTACVSSAGGGPMPTWGPTRGGDGAPDGRIATAAACTTASIGNSHDVCPSSGGGGWPGASCCGANEPTSSADAMGSCPCCSAIGACPSGVSCCAIGSCLSCCCCCCGALSGCCWGESWSCDPRSKASAAHAASFAPCDAAGAEWYSLEAWSCACSSDCCGSDCM
mmetsp:Transcript_24731/g.82223  ORF Transcript_24731/g.82223 Transcript_24731/m.82223 type:complete len:213 (-) Transcript_24731:507-1145(-)